MIRGRKSPTESGWYWYRPKGAKQQYAVEVIQDTPCDVRMRLPGSVHYIPLNKSEGLWGDRIEEILIEDVTVCDFCPNKSDLRTCESCGKDLCDSHRYTICERTQKDEDIQVALCPTCKDIYSDQTTQLLRSFKKGF